MPVLLLPSRPAANARPLGVCALVALALLAGCDAQASTKYRGQPLLTMSGKVELALEAGSSELAPALAFYDRGRATIEIVDVEAQGEFPAEFTIQVYDPPPASYVFPILRDEQEPTAALAFITAVSPSHPETIEFANTHHVTQSASSCGDGECQCPASGCVRTENTWCTNDGEACFVEKVICPERDSPDEDCTVERSGDPSFAESPWRSFAGLSENYAIVYVDQALAAGSQAALTLGTRDALEQGYNLLAIRAPTLEERLADVDCANAAAALALERFNDEHGTDFDELTIAGASCGPGLADPLLCPQPASSEQSDAYYALLDTVKAEEGCLLTSFIASPVTGSEAITIHIGYGFDPLSEASGEPPSEESSPRMPPNPDSPSP